MKKNLFFLIAFTGLLSTVQYVSAADTWDNHAIDFITSNHGDGSKERPYEIANAGQLAYLAKQVNTNNFATLEKYFKLTADINLAGKEWVPIGNFEIDDEDIRDKAFRGIFDGNGYTVSNITILNQEFPCSGLFGVLYSGARVQNLNLKGGEITDFNNVGSIAGAILCTWDVFSSLTIDSVKVDRCSSSVKVTGCGSKSYVGGIIGYARVSAVALLGTIDYSAIISHCVNNGSVTGEFSEYNTGGIIGYGQVYGIRSYMGNGIGVLTVTDCINNGDVKGKSSASNTGGIIGYGYSLASNYGVADIFINYCENNGAITGFSSDSYTGGIIGEGFAGCQHENAYNSWVMVNYCTNNGIIKGEGCMGGIAGCISNAGNGEAKVVACINNNNLTGNTSNHTYTGGIVGWIYFGEGGAGENGFIGVLYCINSGQIAGGNTDKSNAGGIVGFVAFQNMGEADIFGCVNNSKAKVTCKGYTGGIVGELMEVEDIAGELYIYACANNAIVEGGAANSYTGGIIGYGAGIGEIIDCYNYATITSGGHKGGAAGYISPMTLSNVYFVKDANINSGLIGVGEGTNNANPLTIAEFKEKAKFNTWAFDVANPMWTYLDTDKSRPYPYAITTLVLIEFADQLNIRKEHDGTTSIPTFTANMFKVVRIVNNEKLNVTVPLEKITGYYLSPNVGTGIPILVSNLSFPDDSPYMLFNTSLLGNVGEIFTIPTAASVEDASTIKLYPNPATDQIHIGVDAVGPYTIQIYNTLGQLMVSTNGVSPETILDIKHLQSGIYVIKIEKGNKKETKKLVKN